ncbi:ribosomal protein S21 family protein [Wolffia australiana]
MNRVAGIVSSFFRRQTENLGWGTAARSCRTPVLHGSLTMLGAVRGIRVRVRNGNLEQALAIMNRKMQSSGMERLLKRARLQERHLKNSEKRVLAQKNLERRIRAQEFHKKLRQALVNKLRGL